MLDERLAGRRERVDLRVGRSGLASLERELSGRPFRGRIAAERTGIRISPAFPLGGLNEGDVERCAPGTDTSWASSPN